MKIETIDIQNFKGYESFKVAFDPQLNVIVGNNGVGKTAILEALSVAIGSYFLGIRNASTRSIRNNEIHISSNEYSEELLLPVVISAKGKVHNIEAEWTRELNGLKNKTTSGKAGTIKKIAQNIDKLVRSGETIELPLIAYYSTGRLFDEIRNKKTDSTGKTVASRFRAYNRCLDSKSTFKTFQNWYKNKELSSIQKGNIDSILQAVKNAITSNIPECSGIYYEFDEDRINGMKIEFSNGEVLPFDVLSDGTRNYIAIIADLAYKCIVLNPHLQSHAISQTNGVVLIDELDLHLHPEWQKKILHSLINTFPSLQFIVTTHSPFLIQETGHNQLIKLEEGENLKIASGNNLSIEDIAEEIQDVDNPQWSKQRELMFEKARIYYNAKKSGADTFEMKHQLDEAMKPFSRDTVLYALLEQEKIKEKFNKSSSNSEG